MCGCLFRVFCHFLTEADLIKKRGGKPRMEPRQMDKGPHADNSIARLDRATRTLIVIAVLLIEARHLKRCIV